MYAVTGITGKVGGVVARTLLAAGLPIRPLSATLTRAGHGPSRDARSPSRRSLMPTV
jgi:uncharacterized protein YbjT (DUF2867 family)